MLGTTLRLLTATGAGFGTYFGSATEVMAWLNAIAALKDASEAAVWAVGRERVRGLEERAGLRGRAWMRGILAVGFVVGGYLGRHSAGMGWISSVATVKDVSQGLVWCFGRERWQEFGDMALVAVHTR